MPHVATRVIGPKAGSHAIVGAMLLTADVGGTNTTVALVDASGTGGYRIKKRHRARSQEIDGLSEAIREGEAEWDLSLKDSVSLLVVSAAGPVENNTGTLTNVSWTVKGAELGRQLGFPAVVINDFTAVCYGIPVFLQDAPDKVGVIPGSTPLQPRVAKEHPEVMAVVGPGTGLGVGFLLRRGDDYLALPSEGGHMIFAPFDEETEALKRFLQPQSEAPLGWEPFVSGRGIADLFAFVAGRRPNLSSKARDRIMELPREERPAAVAAAAARDPVCKATIDLFLRLLGAFCSNIAVASLPRAGLFLSGGAAIRNPEWFNSSGTFLKSFRTSYRHPLGRVLEEIPVALVRDYDISLYGAAYFGMRRIST